MKIKYLPPLIVKKNRTVGDLERFVGRSGIIRNKKGRDVRSDKFLANLVKKPW